MDFWQLHEIGGDSNYDLDKNFQKSQNYSF